MKVEVAEHPAVNRVIELIRAMRKIPKLSVNEVITASTQSMVGGPFERG